MKNKFRSIISMLLVSVLLFGVAAAGMGSAAAAETTTYVEGAYHYSVTDGKATITNVVGTESSVTVPATLGGYPVIAIGELSFREEGNLISVVIPASIETIGKSAFTSCTALQTVTFADNSKVKTLEETTFYSCKSLKNVNFGSNSSLESIGRSVFLNCTALETIVSPDSLKEICSGAFEGCTSLKNVTISKNIATVGEGAFAHCEALEKFNVAADNPSFTTDNWGILYNKDKTAIVAYPAGNKRPVYTIPAYIESVEGSAFKGSIYLEDVTWLNSETEFGISAFSYCTNLYRVTIPEGATHLKDWMFNACFSLTEVNFPDSLEIIDAGAFHWCTGLEHIELPEGLVSIYSNAFKECFGLKSVVLPQSLTVIGPTAFSRCFGLEEINIHENITQIGNTAFYQCYSLKEFTFPTKVKYVNSEVLRYCYGLESVTFSENTYWIEGNSLMDCRGLETVKIPASVNSMSGAAFINCISLANVEVDEANKNYKTAEDGVVYTESGKTLVYYPAAKAGSVYFVPETVTNIGKSAFASAQNLATVVIHAGVTNVQDAAFDGYNIRDIYFEGTEEQWNAFPAADDDAVKNATVHFNYNGTDHVHDYTQKITTAPTCDVNGKKLYTCSCGESITKDYHYASSRMLCLGSNYEFFDGPDSDCTQKGKSTYNCSKCAKIIDTIDKAKLAHDMQITVSDEKVDYECADCGHTYSEAIPEGAKYVEFNHGTDKKVYILNPGEKLAYPATPKKEGLVFASWVDEDGNKVSIDVMPDRNLVLEPFFEKFVEQNEYGVTARFDEDCFEEGTDVEFVVEEFDGGRTPGAIMFKGENYVPVKLFDISFQVNEKEIQPQSGKSVEVSIPVPEGYEYCGEFLIIHRHANSKYDEFTVKPVNGRIVFRAEKFSEFEISVKTVTEINTLPSKTSYFYKESLDLSGLTLIVTDEGGNYKVISDTSKMTVKGYDPKKIGTQTLTVEYDGASVQFNVTVSYSWWQMIIRILLLGFLWY